MFLKVCLHQNVCENAYFIWWFIEKKDAESFICSVAMYVNKPAIHMLKTTIDCNHCCTPGGSKLISEKKYNCTNR